MAAIGMRHLVAAPITTETKGSAPVYGTGFVMGRAVSGDISWEIPDNDLYGEDTVAEVDSGATGYTMDVGVTELLESVEEKLLGYIPITASNEETGEYEVAGKSAPYVGVGFIQVLKRHGVLSYKAFWYYKVVFARNSENAATKEKQIAWQTPTINGKGLGIYNDASGDAKFRRHKVFSTEAEAAAYLDELANISA